MQKIAIAFFAIFPFEGVEREVEHVAGGAVQSAAVEGEIAAGGIVCNQIIGRGRGGSAWVRPRFQLPRPRGRIFTEWVAQACPIRILVDSFYCAALSL